MNGVDDVKERDEVRGMNGIDGVKERVEVRGT